MFNYLNWRTSCQKYRRIPILDLFFKIYFKDICECFPDTFYRLYVDDSKIYDANVGDVLAFQED